MEDGDTVGHKEPGLVEVPQREAHVFFSELLVKVCLGRLGCLLIVRVDVVSIGIR